MVFSVVRLVNFVVVQVLGTNYLGTWYLYSSLRPRNGTSLEKTPYTQSTILQSPRLVVSGLENSLNILVRRTILFLGSYLISAVCFLSGPLILGTTRATNQVYIDTFRRR